MFLSNDVVNRHCDDNSGSKLSYSILFYILTVKGTISHYLCNSILFLFGFYSQVDKDQSELKVNTHMTFKLILIFRMFFWYLFNSANSYFADWKEWLHQ